MSFGAGTLGNCLKYGLSCSFWQREPSGPQSRSTCSQDLHLPSEPRNPGPPLVPQVALAIDGSARTMAAVATNSFVIFFFSVVRTCTVTRHCESRAHGFFVALLPVRVLLLCAKDLCCDPVRAPWPWGELWGFRLT